MVAAGTGVDYGVLKQWRIAPWWKELEAEVKATRNIALDNKLSKIIERSMEATMDRLENGEVVLNNKTGELIRKPVAMKDAARVANDFLTRQQVLRKEETLTEQVTQQSVNDQLKSLAMEFAKWTSKQKGEVIDVEVKETEDAFHAEWKEGLQTGSSPVYLETGSEEETSGTECSPSGDDQGRESTQG